MSRNVRSLSIKAYVADYAVSKDGTLHQAQATFDTNSKRKIIKAVAEQYDCDPADVVVLKTTEFATKYRIVDIIAAMRKLEDLGLARPIKDYEDVEEDEELDE